MAFKTISKNGFDGDRFKFEVAGTELVGYYLGSQEIPINGKNVKRHSFKTATGVVSTLGSANLDDGLTEATPGALTRVVFEEEGRTKKGNRFKRFTVQQDTDDVMSEPAAAPAAQSAPAAQKSYQGSSVASKAAELKGQLNKTVA